MNRRAGWDEFRTVDIYGCILIVASILVPLFSLPFTAGEDEFVSAGLGAALIGLAGGGFAILLDWISHNREDRRALWILYLKCLAVSWILGLLASLVVVVL